MRVIMLLKIKILVNYTFHPEPIVNNSEVITLLAMLLESQSRPSYSPSPEVAQVLWMYL